MLFAKPPVKGSARDPENGGRRSFIAVDLVQYVTNITIFKLFKAEQGLIGGTRGMLKKRSCIRIVPRGVFANTGRQMFRTHIPVLAKHHGAFNGIMQFANISGERVIMQHFLGARA